MSGRSPRVAMAQLTFVLLATLMAVSRAENLTAIHLHRHLSTGDCPAGFSCDAGDPTNTGLHSACAAGTYSLEGENTCSNCPAAY
jgi:hypothetical protein